jgi:protein-disulfide isomerase
VQSARKVLELVLTVVLATCAVAMTITVVRREPSIVRDSQRLEVVKDWEALSDGRLLIGPASASSQLVVFTDFQCPYCRKLAQVYDSLRHEFPIELKVVIRHFPISTIHSRAFELAAGAECANRVGRFVEYHDVVFENQDSLSLLSLPQLAHLSGIADTAGFEDCLSEHGPSASVRSDSLLGMEHGLLGTPLVILDGLKFAGTPPDRETLRKRIRTQLKRAGKLR